MLKTILNFVLQRNLNFTGALDKYDDRNFSYEAIAWADMQTSSLPTRYVMQDNYYTDQWYSWRYKCWCVPFSTTNAINEVFTHYKNDPKDLFEEMVLQWLLDINSWAYVIDWPKTAQKMWWINWYTQVSTIEQMKHSLYNNRPIVTWSNKANWDLIKQLPYLLWFISSSYGHAFTIVWYDDELNGWCFICENSYGTWLWDKGRFYLRYTDVDKILFNTRLALFTNESTKFQLLRDYIKQATKMWYDKFTNQMSADISKDTETYRLKQEAWRIAFWFKQHLIKK